MYRWFKLRGHKCIGLFIFISYDICWFVYWQRRFRYLYCRTKGIEENKFTCKAVWSCYCIWQTIEIGLWEGYVRYSWVWVYIGKFNLFGIHVQNCLNSFDINVLIWWFGFTWKYILYFDSHFWESIHEPKTHTYIYLFCFNMYTSIPGFLNF